MGDCRSMDQESKITQGWMNGWMYAWFYSI